MTTGFSYVTLPGNETALRAVMVLAKGDDFSPILTSSIFTILAFSRNINETKDIKGLKQMPSVAVPR